MYFRRILCWGLLLVLSFLSACTPIPTVPNDSSTPISGKDSQSPNMEQDETSRPGVREFISSAYPEGFVIWNNMAFTRKNATDLSTGEVFSLCSNPMCGSKHDELCAISIMNRYQCFAVCPDKGSDDMVIYASNRDLQWLGGTMQVTDSFRKYNFSTGTQEVLLDNIKLNDTAWRMDPETKIIYFLAYETNEETENELWLCALNTVTKENHKLGVVPEQVMPTGIIGEYIYAFSTSGTIYRFRTDESSFEIEALSQKGVVCNGYLYFTERKGDVLKCPVPDEIAPYCEKYNAQTHGEFRITDYYRLDLAKKDAVPELVVKNLQQISIGSQYICYTLLEPRYKTSYLQYPGKMGTQRYEVGDPDCPAGATLVHEFTPHNGTVYVIKVDTLELVTTVSSERYSIEFASCVETTTGLVADFKDYSLDSIFAGQMTFKGYVPFNKPVLTEEDAVRIQLD